MSCVVVLDSGLLGLLLWRRGIPEVDACREWQRSLLSQGIRIILPAIADYEVRRELLRLNYITSTARWDALAQVVEYV